MTGKRIFQKHLQENRPGGEYMNITDRVYTELQSQEYKARIVSIKHLATLQREIGELYEQTLIDNKLHEYYLQEDHDFSLLDQFPTAHSLIIVTAPCRQTRLVFTRHNKRIPVILPPGYVDENRNRQQAEAILSQVFRKDGYQVRQAQVPEKLLAVHSGLGRYGKNNVCYVPGMGSFHTLATFCSDFPCEDDSWQEIAMSEECRKCSACLKQCPTGAIVEDRFLIHAERCLTFFNELPGIFPDWLDPSWHHCLVGCLKCQAVCPQNRHAVNDVEDTVEFTEDETGFLLQWQQPVDKIPEKLNEKLRKLGLMHYCRVLSRNLNAVLSTTTNEE
jgi:epoxyqueuosine reductase